MDTSEPLLDWHMAVFTDKCSPFKLSTLWLAGDTLPWVQKQVEALAKQDHFQCWLAVTPDAVCITLHAWSKNHNFHCQQPVPQMDRSQSMNADCKILDHYISVCAVFLVHFYSSFNCINKAQQSMSLIFFPLPSTDWIVCIIVCFKWNGWENHQTTGY